jgi:hypothetical protein
MGPGDLSDNNLGRVPVLAGAKWDNKLAHQSKDYF